MTISLGRMCEQGVEREDFFALHDAMAKGVAGKIGSYITLPQDSRVVE